MNKSDFSRLFERVQRSHDAVYRKADLGFVQSLKHSDGSSTHLEMIGIKAPELLEDELLNLFIWIWSMKDYLKSLCTTLGIAGSRVEQIANVERSLSIAADIANRAKHGVLRESRCGDFAKLQNVRISVPHSALASNAFQKPTVKITVNIPEDAELFAEIGFESGLAPIDAFQTASQPLTTQSLQRHSVATPLKWRTILLAISICFGVGMVVGISWGIVCVTLAFAVGSSLTTYFDSSILMVAGFILGFIPSVFGAFHLGRQIESCWLAHSFIYSTANLLITFLFMLIPSETGTTWTDIGYCVILIPVEIACVSLASRSR